MTKQFGLICMLSIFSTINNYGQNVGIGTNAPTNNLHILSGQSYPLRIQSSNANTSEILFENTTGFMGYVGMFSGNLELMAAPNRNLVLGANNANIMHITTGGNVGLGIASPSEKFSINNGNIQLINSTKGVILNNADRPFITRGFDAFTSGNYTGIGRWGMFMEPNRLTLGIPNLPGKAVEIAAYNVNSTRTSLLTINETGQVRRPPTGNADLMPVCMGSIRWNNGSLVTNPIINGTGNFTLSPATEDGMVEITINGHSYSTVNYVTSVNCIRDVAYGTTNGHGYAAAQDSGNGKLRVYTYLNNGTQYSRSFHFVVYKIN